MPMIERGNFARFFNSHNLREYNTNRRSTCEYVRYYQRTTIATIKTLNKIISCSLMVFVSILADVVMESKYTTILNKSSSGMILPSQGYFINWKHPAIRTKVFRIFCCCGCCADVALGPWLVTLLFQLLYIGRFHSACSTGVGKVITMLPMSRKLLPGWITSSLEIKVYFVVLCELWPMAELAIKCTVSVHRPAARLRRESKSVDGQVFTWITQHWTTTRLVRKNKLHTHFGAIQIQEARDWASW